MRAITISNYGGPEMLTVDRRAAETRPAPDEALVRIHAAGVNFVDIYQRRGIYPVNLPFIPGLEAAGVVESRGREREGCPARGPGSIYRASWAATANIPSIKASRLIRLPRDLSFRGRGRVPSAGDDRALPAP